MKPPLLVVDSKYGCSGKTGDFTLAHVRSVTDLCHWPARGCSKSERDLALGVLSKLSAQGFRA